MALADISITSAALGWLATFLVHSTLWIGGAWLLVRRVESAAWRERLWRGSIAGGLLTSALVMALPDARVGWRWEMPASGVQTTASERPARDFSPIALDVQASPVRDPQAVSTAAPATPAPASRSTTASGWSWNTIQFALVCLWLAGAAISLAQLAWAHLRLARLLRSRRTLLDHALMPALARLAGRAGLTQPPSLSTSTSLPAPVALARGEIVVPERALARLGTAELESLLGHELAHLARRDPWWLLALNILRRALWLQPLLSLATARAIEAAEMRCDELAARWTRGELALARCLAEVATWIEGRPATRLLAGMAEQPSALVERVERLLSPRPVSHSQGVLVATWLIGMLSALSCAGPEVESRGSKSAAPPQQHSGEAADSLRQLGYTESTEYEPTQAPGESKSNPETELTRPDTYFLGGTHILRGFSFKGDGSEPSPSIHIIRLHADGSIDCLGTQLVAPDSKDDSALIEHLKAIATEWSSFRKAPKPGGLPPIEESLCIQAEGTVGYALVYRVVQASAASDVGLTRFILLANDGSTRMPVESSSEPNGVPNSINISVFASQVQNAPRIAYNVLRRRDSIAGGETRGVIGLTDISSLESQLREYRTEQFDYPVLIDAAPEVLSSELLEVCGLAHKVGFHQIRLAVVAQD